MGGCNTNEKIKNSLYPDSESLIRYQDDWKKSTYFKRINNFKENPIGRNKVVFLGNSITNGLRKHFSQFNRSDIVNRGIDGDISLGILEKNIQREVNKYKSFQNELDSTNYKELDTGVENHISYLSNLYVKYFSPLKPRVIVIGKSVYLEKNALFIRSLLLAGIRASMLWRLSGGSKWHFLMYRKKILQKINDYLKI